MQRSRLHTSTAIAVLMAFGLSACGGGSTGGGGPISTPTPTPTPTTPAPTPSPTPTPTPATDYNTAEYQRSNGAVAAQAIEAYNAGWTGNNVILAVVDSGINPDLADFNGRIHPNSRDTAGERGVSDEDGHGTSVTAVAAAGRDGNEIMGVAFNSTILSYRTDSPESCASEDGCNFFDADIARAINSARILGAKVINLSLGGSEPGNVLIDAIRNAAAAGIVIVISAGNDGRDMELGKNADPFALIPAQMFPNNIIIAGSVGVNDGSGGTDLNQISEFSNRAGEGAQYYLSALGYRVRSFDHTGTPYLYSGTSYSAPVISGAVALLFQAFPNLSAKDVIDILFNSADDLGDTGVDNIYGHGRLNLDRAFSPAGSTSLAGSRQAVSLTYNGDLPSAAGDAASQGELGAVILDHYNRAYRMDMAKSLAAAPRSEPMRNMIGAKIDHEVSSMGPVSISMTVAPKAHDPMEMAIDQTQLGSEMAEQAHLIASTAIARLDAKTKAAFGFGTSASSLDRQLRNARQGAFMVARDAAGQKGFASFSSQSAASRRALDDKTGLTLAMESGRITRRIEADRRAPYKLASVTIDRALDAKSDLALGFTYLDESETLLGARLGEMFGAAGANSRFLDASLGRDLGQGWSIDFNARRGWTNFASGRFQSSAYSMDLAKAGVFDGADRLGLRLSQPLRVESGGISAWLPQSYDYFTYQTGYGMQHLSLTPSGREFIGELGYGRKALKGWLDVNAFTRLEPGHVANADTDVGAAVRFTKRF